MAPVSKRVVVCFISTATLLLFLLPQVHRIILPVTNHRLLAWWWEAPCPLQTSRLRLSDVTLRPTALASYPGSGNTWTRTLLHNATGIKTASDSKPRPVDLSVDKSLAARVIVVKTHFTPENARTIFSFDRAVLLIRNPKDAILAEFNRLSFPADHPELSGIVVRRPQDFIKEWPKFVSKQMLLWRSFNLAWARSDVPLHVLLYHRMEAQLAWELRHVIRFINETSIVPRIECALKARNYLSRRQKPDWQRDAAVYSARQTAYLNNAIDTVHATLKAKTGVSFDDMLLWKR